MSIRRLNGNSRIRRILTFILFFALLASPVSTSSADYPNKSKLHGKYLVDFVPVNTPGTRSPLTQATVDTLMKQLDLSFSNIAGEKIKFEFGKILDELNTTVDIRTVTDLRKEMEGKFRESVVGYVDVMTVGVRAKDNSIAFAGQATTGDFVLMNGIDSNIVMSGTTLFHEIGHNLRMGHSNSLVCSGAVGQVTCDWKEYGDRSDEMGDYLAVNEQTQPQSRLSAVNLDHLGLLEDSQIARIDGSGEVTLTPVYSSDKKGTKLLYIPLYGRDLFAIEYRPGEGLDAGLAKTKINVPNGNGWYYTNIPSYGLQLRMIGYAPGSGENLYPTLKDYKPALYGIESFIFVSSHEARQGIDVGASQTFPDGSVVNFLSYDPASGAKVKITRPADTKSPSVEIGSLSIGDNQLGSDDTIQIMKGAGGVYQWPKLNVELASLSDDRRVTELELLVDDKSVKTVPAPTTGKATIDAVIEAFGEHKIRLRAKDAAGNVAETSRTIQYKPYTIPKPDVEVIADETSMQILIFDNSPTVATRDAAIYDIKDLSAGTIKKIDRTGTGTTSISVVGLKRNSKLTFTVEAKDSFGNEGITFTTTEAVEETQCELSYCYVGVEMNYADLIWQTPSPNLRLQVLVKKKWKNLASALPYTSDRGTSEFPYAYDLKYAFPKAGTYYLRIYQDPHSFKGKKYGAYIGKQFWQRISP